jgi:hypothetical protein
MVRSAAPAPGHPLFVTFEQTPQQFNMKHPRES